MATALLIATSQRSAAWQPARQKSPSKRQGGTRGGQGERVFAGVRAGACTCVFFGGGGRRAARRKEKLARENKVNEAWRRLPFHVFGWSSRASSFIANATPGGRTEEVSLERGEGGCGGGAGGENSQAVTGFYVFTRAGRGCWLRQHLTAQARNPLPLMLKQTLTFRLHLHPHPPNPVENGSLRIEKDLWDEVSRGHVVHNNTISRFEAITITMACFVHWLITTGGEGNSRHQPESPCYTYLLVEIYDNSRVILSGQ